MPSRGRLALESGLRALAFAAVGGLLWLTVHADRNGDGARAHGDGAREALARWSTREAPGRVRAEFDSAPSPETRDWLAALGRAGTSVTWGGTVPIPIGIAAEPVADPRRPIQAWGAAPAATPVVLRDRLGVVDSGAMRREMVSRGDPARRDDRGQVGVAVHLDGDLAGWEHSRSRHVYRGPSLSCHRTVTFGCRHPGLLGRGPMLSSGHEKAPGQ
jgi:hypothetical protein